jgi:hypothetical protein
MNKYISALALSVLSAAAQAASLLAPGAHDQIPAALAHTQAPGASALERTPVRVSHALDASATIDLTTKPYLAQSREFWSDVGESELRGGVKFTTTAPGALIRLSPQGGAGAALDPAGVLIRSSGKNLRADEAGAAADTKALRAAGMDVTEGTLAMRLSPTVGQGQLEIAAPHAQGRYLVHVFDPNSAVVLGFGADHDTVLVGSTITFRAGIDGRELKHASGLVTAPDGYSADLKFSPNTDGSFSARFTPDAAHAIGPQLWEAHVFTAATVGKLGVLRDAKTAFAVSAPTARFAGAAESHSDASGVHVTFDVEAGAASRFQLSGVLYGTAGDGTMRAAALGQSAAWLEVGTGQLALSFDTDVVAASGLRAPFEVRDLRLVDQATMGLIERREHGLVIR